MGHERMLAKKALKLWPSRSNRFRGSISGFCAQQQQQQQHFDAAAVVVSSSTKNRSFYFS